MTFTPFPELQTKRLLLRQLTEQDSPIVLHLRSDKTINTFIQRPPERQTKTLADATKHIKKLTTQIENNQSITWGITRRDQPDLIGTICLWNFSEDLKIAEVGYDLDTIHQAKGFMTEALQAVITFGFNSLKFNTIEAYTQHQNKNSVKLLKRNGFSLNDSKKDEGNPKNIVFECFSKHKKNKLL